MKILYKKEKGVSPVIATILMVAITVVLASAVYLMVSGYIGSAPSKPVALGVSPSTTTTATQFLITSGNISVNPGSPLIITVSFTNGTVGSANIWVLGKSGGYTFNTTSPQTTFGNIINIYTVSGAHYLAAGDTISISISNAPLPPGTTVTFTYNGNVIYKYTA